MGIRRAAPTEIPSEVLDRVLDKGIVAGASLRRGGAVIELVGSAVRIVAESEVHVEAEPRRTALAA